MSPLPIRLILLQFNLPDVSLITFMVNEQLMVCPYSCLAKYVITVLCVEGKVTGGTAQDGFTSTENFVPFFRLMTFGLLQEKFFNTVTERLIKTSVSLGQIISKSRTKIRMKLDITKNISEDSISEDSRNSNEKVSTVEI